MGILILWSRSPVQTARAGSGWANMDGNTCCMYFCTGLSMFGVVCLAVMGVVLNAGGAWYLGVKDEDAGAAAASCLPKAVGLALALDESIVAWRAHESTIR